MSGLCIFPCARACLHMHVGSFCASACMHVCTEDRVISEACCLMPCVLHGYQSQNNYMDRPENSAVIISGEKTQLRYVCVHDPFLSHRL